jgi:signal transduction histidine kinase/CheY-like chemotaxis protein/CHASE3 domain sensor protein
MPEKTTSIVRNLQLTFTISIALLILSLLSSFFSVQKLIDNSHLVNHTNEVLIESQNIISYMKDGETGQRGYLVTGDEQFLQPYKGAREKALASNERVRQLTEDNPQHQDRSEQMKKLINQKFDQMEYIIQLTRDSRITRKSDSVERYNEMLTGKKIMDDLRIIVKQIKTEEQELLEKRTDDQEAYVGYTRLLVVLASVISILITAFSYFKIKKDMDLRIAKQLEDERNYTETNERIAAMEVVTGNIAQGKYDVRSEDVANDEMGRIGKALNNMAEHLQANFDELSDRSWLQEGTLQIANSMRGERNPRPLAGNILNTLAEYLDVPVATLYVRNRQSSYNLLAERAAEQAQPHLEAGEGLTGQALQSGKISVLTDLPTDYLPVKSTTGSTDPVSLIIVPLLFENEAMGVVEIGLLRKPTEREITLLRTNAESIGIALNMALDNQLLQELFEEVQAQSEELQSQHSELENLNSELEAQAMSLQASEEELKVQQEELQQTNAELEERTVLLEEQNREIERKAAELEQSTRYKSEFLANMSHELRTPLNSILLLSRLLADNNEHTMSSDQVEYARVIQSSGNGLLWLIDEILDLSKIESGKMQLEYDRFQVKDMVNDLESVFRPLARDKQIELLVDFKGDFPKTLETDRMRLEQILKNLLSNAIKFTAEGAVTLIVRKCPDKEGFVCFSVKDTGIGIPKEKQDLVFHAFQQADGSTKRKYGGTGLGLSISKELVKLLGGELELTSEPGKGSQFTIRIPLGRSHELSLSEPKTVSETVVPDVPAEEQEYYVSDTIPASVSDDRKKIKPGDKVILIVEDDVNFAKSLLSYTRKKGYKGVVSVRGDEGLLLAQTYQPAGILLDIQLPVKSGWEVMDELKKDPATRHIPVHIMSSFRKKRQSLQKGAVDFIEKPFAIEHMQEIFNKIEYVLTKHSKKVLIIEDNPKHAEALSFFLASNNISSDVRQNVSESVTAFESDDLDCVILDMGIPAGNAYEVLEEVKKTEGLENLPIIIFTGKSLSIAEEQRIRKYADSIVVKTAHSYQRMLDEVSLFLHLVEEQKMAGQQSDHRTLGALNEVLNNKTVLIADDDIRNIFSLTKALENLKLNVIAATDGKEALQKLGEHPEVDILLLDMMMPHMDGYETASKIREMKQYKKLPIIAVTAKAMTGDREKCISAGASDYITKPVDIDQLLSLLRVWLYETKK